MELFELFALLLNYYYFLYLNYFVSRGVWENISSEVSNFIRTNESRPHFLIQLFRDLQLVTSDNLRQRTLESIQETVNANNLSERVSNMNGANVVENRNNIRENRSNLNRNQSDDPNRIDELFCHLRENQNTIRQNIGMSCLVLGGNNLENPNISNIRDLMNPRNNLENEGLRDLKTYYEASLCSFGGHHSTLENPNLSNIRENLTRREPNLSDYENLNPKNVYLSIHDNAAAEMRRRNQEITGGGTEGMGSAFTNVYLTNEFPNESARTSNNHFGIGSSFEHFGNLRQCITNGNDSGIDINFNNEERKRNYIEGNAVSVNKPKKNGENLFSIDFPLTSLYIRYHIILMSTFCALCF